MANSRGCREREQAGSKAACLVRIRDGFVSGHGFSEAPGISDDQDIAGEGLLPFARTFDDGDVTVDR